MKRYKPQPYVASEPDAQEVIATLLNRLIRSALEASAAPTPGYNYTEETARHEAAGVRAKVLRRLRDEFELAMAGVELEP